VKKKNNPGDLVIVNLQETPLDMIASLRIFAKCDDVSKLLAEKLSVEIPAFRLKRSATWNLLTPIVKALTQKSQDC